MTDDRHPGLQALFDAARPPDANSMLVEKVMAKIEQDRRRTMLGWIVAGVVLIPIAWWLSAPVVQIAGGAEVWGVEVETTWLAQITAPINSVSFVVGMTFLVAWRFFWKLRH